MTLPSPLVDALAVAHEAPSDGTVWWQSWGADPTFLLLPALLTWCYLRGLRRWRDRSRPHPAWRTAAFLIGIALLVLAQESPLDWLAARHLTFHMIQHEVVTMLAVPAILLGAPATPVLRGMPAWLRRGVIRPLARSAAGRAAYEVLTGPAVAAVAFIATVWGWHLVPGWYDAALRQPWLHAVQHATFAAAAGLFWWNILPSPPHRPRLEAMPRILYLVAAGTLKDGAAALIVFASTPLYQEYAHVSRIVAWSPLRDQQIGGLVMWIPGTLLMLGVAGAIFVTAYATPPLEPDEASRVD